MSPAGEVRAVLSRRGWALSRRADAGRLSFVVSRDGRELFEFTGAASPQAGRSLMPAVRLKTVPRAGARLTAADKAGQAELRAALDLLMETARRAGAAGGTALSESHEGHEGRDLLLRTTFACNQKCAFCFVPMTGKSADFAEIERELDAQASRAGERGELTLSGGEPTSDPRLLKIVDAARARGFRRFVLQTNGVYLARPGLLDELVRRGVKAFLFSLHSHKPAAYDAITGSRGQYARAVKGLEALLKRPGLSVTVNTVVNARNYRDLPGLVEFLARRGRPDVYFSMINEVGHQKAPSWTVALEDAAPFLRRAVARCREKGLSVSRSGGESSFPVCLLGDPARHASKRPLPQERVRYAEDFSGEAGVIGRAKLPSCRSCVYDARCVGVPAQYARLHGLAALRAP